MLMLLLFATICIFISDSCQKGNILYNRNGRYLSNVTLCEHPWNESEIISLIQVANANNASIRAVAKSHSMSAVSMIDNEMYNNLYLLNLSTNMKEIIDIDLDEMTITFESGLSQYDVALELSKYNLSIANFGGTMAANFVGSAMTGTHSAATVANPVSSVASNIIALRLIVSNGTIIIANNTFNKDIFDAARTSFGSLGIITEITIKAKPMYYLTRYSNINIGGLTNLSLMINAIYDNLYLWYNLSDAESGLYIFSQRFQSNRAIKVDLDDVNADIYPDTPCWNPSIRPCTDIYFNRNSEPNYNEPIDGSKPQETEFFVDQSVWLEAYIGVIEWIINENKLKQTTLWNLSYTYYLEYNNDISIRVRFVKEDDIWLSPSYKKNVTQIAIYWHASSQSRPPDYLYDEWVNGIYKVLQRYDNTIRFHWGKQSMVGAIDLQKSYPMFDEFVSLQNKLDPNQIFVNKFIQDKLGLCSNDNQCCCTNYTCSVIDRCVEMEKEDDNFWDNNWIYIVIIPSVLVILVLIVVIYRKNNRSKTKTKQSVTYMTMGTFEKK